MKDTVTLFAINYIIYLLYFSVFKKKFKPLSLVLVVLLSFLIVGLKAYILLAFLPGLFLGLYVMFSQSIRSPLVRYILGPIIFVGLISTSFLGLSLVSEGSEKYEASNLEWKVKGFHSWHTDVGGSSYNLGDIEYTASGVARKIPAALNVTFFRPYLWEARNPVVFLGALESLLFLGLFVYILIKFRLKFIREIKVYPLLYGMFIYCLVFGFAVGFTSYNFGALARYKIPILSLFGFILFFLYYKATLKGQKSKSQLSGSPSDQENNIL